MGGHHDHTHHDHSNADASNRLAFTLVLVLTYMVAEVVGGLLSNSLALLADAGHMLSDAGALIVSLFALRIARRPASTTHTFGYQRAEILAAMANGAALLAIAGYIVFEAIERTAAPPHVRGGLMLGIATGGLAINLTSLWLLHGGKDHSLNVRGAWLHVLADTMGSVGAITAGLLIMGFGWYWADPAASLIIAMLVLYSAFMLLKQTVGVLMQGVPDNVDLAELDAALLAVDGVRELHDLHVWAVTPGRNILSAHITVEPKADRDRLIDALNHRAQDFDVHHTTFQCDCPADCVPCPPPLAARSG